ncbi:hypothetical protein HQ520_11610, partial [bacterium]|nr:hypothetical protein [bacterium]
MFVLMALTAQGAEIQTRALQQCGLGSLHSVRFAPDGARALTGGKAGAYLWHASSGALIRSYTGHTDYVTHADLSPDGKLALTAGGNADTRILMWDIETGRPLFTIERNTVSDSDMFLSDNQRFACKSVSGLEFRSVVDGSVDLLLSFGAEVSSWGGAMSSWQPAYVFSDDCSRVLLSAYVIDQQTVARGRVYDTHTGELLVSLGNWIDWFSAGDMSPDGSLVAWAVGVGTPGQTIRISLVTSGQTVHTLNSSSQITIVRFSHDGTRLLTAGNGDNAIWNVQTGQKVCAISSGFSSVMNAAWTPDDSRVVLTLQSGEARVCHAGAGTILRSLRHPHLAPFLEISPEGDRALIGAFDQRVYLWDLDTGHLIQVLRGHTNDVLDADLSADGQQMVTGHARGYTTGEDGYQGTANLWDLQTGALLGSYASHDSSVSAVALSPDDSQLMTGGWDRKALLWDVKSGNILTTFSELGLSGANVMSVDFSADGQLCLAAMSDGECRVWEMTGAPFASRSFGPTFVLDSASFSPASRKVLIVGGPYPPQARVWDLTGGTVLDINAPEGHYCGEFSPDGSKVILGHSGDSIVAVWDSSTGAALKTFSTAAMSVALSPDGQRAAVG